MAKKSASEHPKFWLKKLFHRNPVKEFKQLLKIMTFSRRVTSAKAVGLILRAWAKAEKTGFPGFRRNDDDKAANPEADFSKLLAML